MNLESKLTELSKVVSEHKELLQTEEAAKNALVMPFIQALGYNVFDPSEVTPEFIADVGTKKGEKVDYALRSNEKVSILIECKPVNSDLNSKHASQLYRYFTSTEARIAILTNGLTFKFYSDIETPNVMDSKPFFIFDLEAIKSSDFKTLANFSKAAFDISKILAEAGNLKIQSLVAKELNKEFSSPSEEFVRIIANRVHEGRVTAAIKETIEPLIIAAINSVIRDKVNQRLTSALNASNPPEKEINQSLIENEEIETTQEEIDGVNVIRAIASRLVEPNRVVMRDAKSYCAVLLDNNNRKTIARLHFNSASARYLGTLSGKEETRNLVDSPFEIYSFEQQILDRIAELEK